MANSDVKIHISADGLADIQKQVGAIENEMRSLGKAVKQSASEAGSFKDAFKSALNNKVLTDAVSSMINLSDGMGQAVRGAANLGTAIKAGLGPVGLLSAAIEIVVGLFKELMASSQAFGDGVTSTMSGVTSAIKSALNNLSGFGDVFKSIGNMIKTYMLLPFNTLRGALEGLFSGGLDGFIQGMKKGWGELTEAWDETKKSLSAVGGAMGEAYEAGKKLALIEDDLGTTSIQWGARQEELNEIMTRSKQIIKDETSTLEQKKKAQKDLTNALSEYESWAKKLNSLHIQNAEALIAKIGAEKGLTKLSADQQKALENFLVRGVNSTDATVNQYIDAISDETHQQIANMYKNASSVQREFSAKSLEALKTLKEKGEQGIKVKVDAEPTAGSLKDLQNQMAKLRSHQESFTIYGSEEYEADKVKIAEIQARIDGIRNPAVAGSTLLDRILGSFSDESARALEEETKAFIDFVRQNFDEMDVALWDGDDIENAREYMSIVQKVHEEQQKQAKFEAKQEKIEAERQEATKQAYLNIADAIAEVTGETEVATTAQKALALATQVQAMAQAIATASEGDPYTVAVRIAAAGAAVVATMSQLTKYASGGIVGGGQVGDQHLARVNGGEIIMNKNQQTRLWNILNGREGTVGATGGQVTFRIEGRDLVGVLNNFNKSNNLLK